MKHGDASFVTFRAGTGGTEDAVPADRFAAAAGPFLRRRPARPSACGAERRMSAMLFRRKGYRPRPERNGCLSRHHEVTATSPSAGGKETRASKKADRKDA